MAMWVNTFRGTEVCMMERDLAPETQRIKEYFSLVLMVLCNIYFKKRESIKAD